MAGKMKTLEERFTELQNIISKLEQGNLSLDASIEAYAQGMKLAASCRSTLDEMQAKVQAAREQALGNAANAGGTDPAQSAE